MSTRLHGGGSLEDDHFLERAIHLAMQHRVALRLCNHTDVHRVLKRRRDRRQPVDGRFYPRRARLLRRFGCRGADAVGAVPRVPLLDVVLDCKFRLR